MADKSEEAKNKRNIRGLQDILWEQIESIQGKDKSKPFDPKRASLVLKAADSMIDTMKVELAYAALRKKTEVIPMLENGSKGEEFDGEKTILQITGGQGSSEESPKEVAGQES